MKEEDYLIMMIEQWKKSQYPKKQRMIDFYQRQLNEKKKSETTLCGFG